MPGPIRHHRLDRAARQASARVSRLAVSVAVAFTTLAVPAVPVSTAVEPTEYQHLLVSEVATGGASASDEFIELYNPGPGTLPLEGLELVYLSATGTTPGRRAIWMLGAPSVPPGAHVLVANEAGIYAPIADAVYTTGIAATGGSVAIRIQGAAIALDAVGWGTAANAWMEGSAAPAPDAGGSIERLPGGAEGSTQDIGNNLADFVLRTAADPQNSTSPAVPDPGSSPTPSPVPSPTPIGSPSASPMPSAPPTSTPGPSPTETPAPSATATPTTDPTPAPTVTPAPTTTPMPSPPAALTVAEARQQPLGAIVTVSGVALTDAAFTDGGGYLTDPTGGIAVLVTDGAFARGDLLRVTGELDDRFSQRTIRALGADVVRLGSGTEPIPTIIATVAVGESAEGQLARISGAIDGAPTTLTSGVAFDVDDGSGPVRVVVGTATGISLDAWLPGATVELVGVVGQRDSTGTGTSGYRVQPRDAADVIQVGAQPTASPAPSATTEPEPSAEPDPTPDDGPPLVSVAEARAAERNERLRVRGVVTLASDTVDAGSAVLQDATGGILLRLGDEAGGLERGTMVEVTGARSTKSGMASLRVSDPPRALGSAAEPAPAARSTGAIGEADEAQLVVVRGGLVANPRRASSGTVSFEIDDGSGAVRVVAYGEVGSAADELATGTWVEVTGVVGQVTTGSAPTRGYRVWPRDPGDLVTLAGPITDPLHVDDADADGASRRSRAAAGSGDATLEGLVGGAAGGEPVTVRATLVADVWPALGLAGVLWDGTMVVGIADEPAARAEVRQVAMTGLPRPVTLRARPAVTLHGELGITIIQVAEGAMDVGTGRIATPAARLPSGESASWSRLSGHLERGADGPVLESIDAEHRLDVRCQPSPLPEDPRPVVVHGIGVASPARLVVGCLGVQAAGTFAALAAASAREVGAGGTADAPPAAGTDPTLAAGAILLGAALLAMAACGVVAWRRRAVWSTERNRDSESEPEAGDVNADSEASRDIAASRLALVELPRDRGSP